MAVRGGMRYFGRRDRKSEWRGTTTHVPLSQRELTILTEAGSTSSTAARQEAAAIVLAQPGHDRQKAGTLLVRGYRHQMQPAFHLIPRGEASESEAEFTRLYERLVTATEGFTRTEPEMFIALLQEEPAALAPLRMILGLTRQELAAALRIVSKEGRASAQTLRNLERDVHPGPVTGTRRRLIRDIAAAATAIMERRILRVPDALADHFRSNLDKRDTINGWRSVAASAGGVPYSALLYQRYVGGVWRQVQDAHSESKGDALLERPFTELLQAHGISHYHTGPGAGGALETKARYGLSPVPDFLIPAAKPTLAVEAKVAEDPETVVDKADHFEAIAGAAVAAGLRPCALIDGKGWAGRTSALARVIIATEGRTYTLATMEQLLELPELAELRGG